MNTLRQQLLQRRAQLSAKEQEDASQAVCLEIAALPIFKQSQRIALYIAVRGEIDLKRIPTYTKQDQICYLPCLDPLQEGVLGFAPFLAPLTQNRYQLWEPAVPRNQWLKATELDLVLTPLVAFDRLGQRMGMGKGYYDRSFAFKIKDPTHPILLGVAYAFQEVPQLPKRAWDIPLDGVVTPNAVHWFCSPGGR